MQACVQDLSKESHGMQKLHQCPYPPQGCAPHSSLASLSPWLMDPWVSMYVHVAPAHGPKTVSGLEEAVGHQPPAHAHNFSCLAGVVWAKKPWVLQWPRASLPMPRPTSFELFLAFSHGPLSMPQKASEHSLPHHH